MIDAMFSSENYQLARQLLDASALRHQAIAANIANAETPGYKRVDLSPDFKTQLNQALQRGELDRPVAGLKLTEDSSARAVRPDGNSVEIEKELLELTRNTSEHNFLTQIVSSNLRSLRIAITGRSG